METIKKATVTVTYNGKNITKDVSAALISFKYQDKITGASDELEITLEDSGDLWKNEWYAGMGAKISAEIGYDQMMPCGDFEIDEINMGISPDTITLRALAVPITGALRTKKNTAHENTSLKEIAQKVATENGLQLEGEIDAMQFIRVTQHQETDLAFLDRMARAYGYIFTIRGKRLVFYSIYKIEAGKPCRVIDRASVIRCDLKDKASKTFKTATLSYHNPGTAKVVQATATVETRANPDGATYTQIISGDDLVIRGATENESQATAKAKAALHQANSKQQEGTITVEGDPMLVAGNVLELTGLGQLSGKYLIHGSTHECDKSGGYLTSLEIKRVGYVDSSKHKKTEPKPRPAQIDVDELTDQGDESTI